MDNNTNIWSKYPELKIEMDKLLKNTNEVENSNGLDELVSANQTRNDLVRKAIFYFFENKEYNADDVYELNGQLLEHINKVIRRYNIEHNVSGAKAYKNLDELRQSELIYVLPKIDNYKIVKRSAQADAESSDLMYQTKNGWYEPAYMHIKKHITKMMPNCDLTSTTNNVIDKIKSLIGETVDECHDPDYTPLLNGVFNKEYWDEHHELIPYTTDRVFTNPFEVNFNPDATEPAIDIDGTIFNIEDWLLEVSAGNEGIKETLWDVFSAILHPFRKYKKALMLYSPIGNNGKGTFLELCRSIVGPHTCYDMSISDFADKHLVVNIASARLVAGDENAVGQYIDNSDNFKKAVTSDPITTDRKYKSSLSFSYKGFIVQCMNDLPTTRDKTNTFYRRLLVLPFDAQFEGIENNDIKDIYVKNKDVLEYVVYKALMRDVKKLTPPPAAECLLQEYRERNDKILQYWKEEGSQVQYQWDRIPWLLLFKGYVWYMHEYHPGVKTIGQSDFIDDFRQKILPTLNDWEEAGGQDKRFRVTEEMKNTVEPLVDKYNVSELMNPNGHTSQFQKLRADGSNGWKTKYPGIIKKKGME